MESAELPNELRALAPTIEILMNGVERSADAGSREAAKIEIASWTFMSWDKEGKTIEYADTGYTGLWVFIADTPAVPEIPEEPVTPVQPADSVIDEVSSELMHVGADSTTVESSGNTATGTSRGFFAAAAAAPAALAAAL